MIWEDKMKLSSIDSLKRKTSPQVNGDVRPKIRNKRKLTLAIANQRAGINNRQHNRMISGHFILFDESYRLSSRL